MNDILTLNLLLDEALHFSEHESAHPEPTIDGVADGKAIGNDLEHKSQRHLESHDIHAPGDSAVGIDFPGLSVDMKVTSIRRPQSSRPFKNARRKIVGLGYSLLIFIYYKVDNHENRSSPLNIQHTIFVDSPPTADEIEIRRVARALMSAPPEQGYLTVSNAWKRRLRYARLISQAGGVQRITRIH